MAKELKLKGICASLDPTTQHCRIGYLVVDAQGTGNIYGTGQLDWKSRSAESLALHRALCVPNYVFPVGGTLSPTRVFHIEPRFRLLAPSN